MLYLLFVGYDVMGSKCDTLKGMLYCTLSFMIIFCFDIDDLDYQMGWDMPLRKKKPGVEK